MARQYDCMDICPEAYQMLSNPSALCDALGCEDLESLLDLYEMTEPELAAFKAKLKHWDSVVPPKYGSQDVYIIPIDMMSDPENMLILDLNDMVCNGETGGYNVFLLSTEDWGMI